MSKHQSTPLESNQRTTLTTFFNTNSDPPPKADNRRTIEQTTSPEASSPILGFETPPSPSPKAGGAGQVDWAVYTGRYPYVFDAAMLGFGIGHREDSAYQFTPDEVNLPVHFLDNDYADPDLDRFVDRVHTYEPEIAVLGDLYKKSELDAHLEAAAEIRDTHPDIELILVPKCESVLEAIPKSFILGFPSGTSPIQGIDIASYNKWRTLGATHGLHILGGTPTQVIDHIQSLTQPTVDGSPPANIRGLDWNGYQKFAENYGDYADATGGWHDNLREAYLPSRDLIRYSLLNAKHFWVSHGVWPTLTTLPDRSTLHDALYSGHAPTNAHRDLEAMAHTPRPPIDQQHSRLCRTDETQTEIIEPVSPSAAFVNATTWTPEGNLSTPTTFDIPAAFGIDRCCAGCGGDLFTPSAHDSTSVTIVSYEQSTETAEHYSSVPIDGPESISLPRTYPALYAYCSDICQQRTEYHNPNQILPNGSRESGVTIARLTSSSA